MPKGSSNAFSFLNTSSLRLTNTPGVAIFAKAFMGIPAQQAAKTTRPLMPAAAPAVLLHSLNTQQGVFNIILAMTRRDFGKPVFSLRKKHFVKTHALSLLGTTRLLSCSVSQYRVRGMINGIPEPTLIRFIPVFWLRAIRAPDDANQNCQAIHGITNIHALFGC